MAQQQRPMPFDFADYVRSGYHSISHLRNHYHCTWSAVYRWLQEADIHQTSKKRMGRDGYNIVMCDLLTGEEIDSFRSIVEAANAVNGTPSSIGLAARGAYKTAYGFRWRYADDTT